MSDAPIRVKPTAEGWRVRFPIGDTYSDGRPVHVGDRYRSEILGFDQTVYRSATGGFRRAELIASPGLPCELEGLEWAPGGRQAACVLCGQRVEELPGPVHQAREALEDARELAADLLSTCPSYRDELLAKISKALEGIS